MASSSTATKFFCLLVIMSLALSSPSLATSYNVGGLTGYWTTALVPILPTWVLSEVFIVGDVLEFKTLGLLPAVPFYVVTAENYASCVTAGALFSGVALNPAIYTLPTAGVHYIIADALSCTLGLKFQITVVVG